MRADSLGAAWLRPLRRKPKSDRWRTRRTPSPSEEGTSGAEATGSGVPFPRPAVGMQVSGLREEPEGLQGWKRRPWEGRRAAGGQKDREHHPL